LHIHLAAFLETGSEPIYTQIAHYILSGVGLLLVWSLRQVNNRLKQQEHTRVKANLCFNDLTERRPEIVRLYQAMMGKNGS
jgi:hypothetical protein